MQEYEIIVKVDEQWLKKWCTINEVDSRLELWMEIQTAGTGISVESVEKINSNEESTE